MKKYLAIALAAGLALPAFAQNPMVAVATTAGDFTIELYQDKAPITVENFLRYVKDGSYVGTQFHRVIPGFVIQGGGYDSNFSMQPTYAAIKNESKPEVKNLKATLSMARMQAPDSATRQFFINLADNNFLDATEQKAGYAVFGIVTEGYPTVEKIAGGATKRRGMMQDVPVKPVVIEKMQLIDSK